MAQFVNVEIMFEVIFHLAITKLDRTALIPNGTNLTRCRKHSSKILVHNYMKGLHSVVGCTFMI